MGHAETLAPIGPSDTFTPHDPADTGGDVRISGTCGGVSDAGTDGPEVGAAFGVRPLLVAGVLVPGVTVG